MIKQKQVNIICKIQFFKYNLGLINSIQFSYILSEYLKLTNEEIEKVLKEMDYGILNKVKYIEFFNLVYNKPAKNANP